jgi:hypothetical protein
VLAGGPAKPTCTHAECVYVWVGNYVPSQTATAFDFLYDQVAVAENIIYGENRVIMLACNSSDSVNHEMAVSSSIIGTTSPNVFPQLYCGSLYSFFASRTTNGANNVEKYVATVRLLEGNVAFGYMSGLVFNGIYRGGQNGVNGKYCDKDSATCDLDHLDHRTGFNVPINQFNEMTLKMTSTFENPVTLNGPGGVTLFDDNVVGSVGDFQVWVFYGDNNDQANFPFQGGVSPASLLTISMTVMIALSAIVSSML